MKTYLAILKSEGVLIEAVKFRTAEDPAIWVKKYLADLPWEIVEK